MSAATRILVVDDNAQNVKLLVQLLRNAGYEMTTASSGPYMSPVTQRWK